MNEIPLKYRRHQITIIYNSERYTGYFNRKSITLNDNFNTRLSISDLIQVAPSTNWRFGHYDQQFKTIDIFCNKCNTASGECFGCKCKPISLEQYFKELEDKENGSS